MTAPMIAGQILHFKGGVAVPECPEGHIGSVRHLRSLFFK